MGQTNNKPALKKEDVNYLIKHSHFTQSEVEKLFEHFCKISGSMQKADTIEFNEFQAALGRDGTFVTGRIFEVLDQNSNSEIDFREFVMGLSALSKRASLEEKIQFSFKIYDIDNNGFIDKNELFQILKASLHDSCIDMTDEQMHSLVDSTFAECDTNHDDQISFDEYREMVMQHPLIAQFLTLPPELL